MTVNDPDMDLFVRLSVFRKKMRTKNAISSKTKQFRAMVSIDDL